MGDPGFKQSDAANVWDVVHLEGRASLSMDTQWVRKNRFEGVLRRPCA